VDSDLEEIEIGAESEAAAPATEESVDISKCRVIPSDHVSLVTEPQVVIRFNKISFNRVCLRRLKGAEYVQLLISQQDRMLYVRPCEEDEKGRIPWFRWGEGRVKLKTRQLSCAKFYALLILETGWNPSNNYKLTGRMMQSKRESILAFELDSKETIPIYSKSGVKIVRTIGDLTMPDNKELGTFEGLSKIPIIKKYKGYTVFTVRKASDAIVGATLEEGTNNDKRSN